MHDHADGSSPLKLAIDAMRIEVDGVIAGELDRLMAGAPGPGASGEGRPAPDREPAAPRIEATGPAAPLDPGPSNPDRAAWDGHEGPRAPAAGGHLEDDDPARRLDALAHRLEGRLRRARDRAAQRPRPDEAAEHAPTGPPPEDSWT